MIITATAGKGDKIHIHIDGEYKMTVDRAFWLSEHWHTLKEIDEEELAALEEAVSSRRAFNTGLTLLSARSHGRTELFRKLSRKHSPEAAENALLRLEELGLLDDEAFAEDLARELFERKHYSPRRIQSELISRGIDREIAQNTAEALDNDDKTRIIILLQTKYSRCLDDEKSLNRTRNALLRLGYSYSDIRSALSELEQTKEDFEDA